MWQQLSGDRHQLKKKKEQKARAPERLPTPAPPPKRHKYDVSLSPEAQVQYDALPQNIRNAMDEKLARLQDWPEVSGVGPMWGEAQGKHRIKFWDWRAIFEVNEQAGIISVEKIEHRSTAYGEFH